MHTSRTAHATGPGAGEHPDLETLAAFLDGKLPDAERARVMKHLAACKACFSLFADTARTLRDLEPAGGKVLRFPFFGRPEVRRALPLAAAAVLVMAAGLGAYAWLWRPPRIEVRDLLADLPDKPGLSAEIWAAPLRGPGEDEEALAFSAQEFQLGARLLDFQFSVEAEDSVKAADAARRIANVLEESGLYLDEVRLFRGVRQSLDGGDPPSRYQGLVAELTPVLEEGFGPPFMHLGMWTAAGRLSAVAEDPAFFERRRNRRFLELLLADPGRWDRDGAPVEPPAEVREELQKVAGHWDERDYVEIEAALTRVLEIYERLTQEF